MLHYLTQYVHFTGVEEMDMHVRQHMKANRLTKSELAIVYCIAGHALATPGVAHLKAETIARECAFSTKTVYRAVKALQSLGILKKVASTKLNGIKAANIYVICPYVPSKMSEREHAEIPCDTKAEAVKHGDESLSFESKTCSKEVYCHENEFHDRLQLHFNYFPLRQPYKQQLQSIIPKLIINTQTQFERAKKIITECVYLVANHHVTLYSTFENFVLGAYKKWTLLKEQEVKEQPYVSTRPVPFYNWIEQRA